MRRFGDVEHGSEIEMESLSGKQRPGLEPLASASQDVRSGFVRKVYSILAMQLLGTVLMSGFIVSHGRQLLHTSPQTVLSAVTLSCILSLLLMGIFVCCPDVMRRSPLNYGLLAAFTLGESIMIGFVCLQYTLGSVVMCAGITAVVVAGLSIYAMRTKTDLTGAGPYLLCCLLVLCGTGLMLSLVAAFGGAHSMMFNALQVMYAAGGALVFSVFIVYDTQLILGGNHQQEFSVDDYAMAAISLYLDIIQLFLALLRLLGQKDDNGL